jgi:hypothetical protein
MHLLTLNTLNASSYKLCIFRQQYNKRKLEPFQLWKKKNVKQVLQNCNFCTEFPSYLFGHVDDMISTFCVVVLLNRSGPWRLNNLIIILFMAFQTQTTADVLFVTNFLQNCFILKGWLPVYS